MSNSKPRLNNEQQNAVSHINGPMMVVAGPGSGKTFLLIERIVNLINNGISPEKILVITFSKKAALEMQSRFNNRTNGMSYNVTFGTFHAVFFHILQFYGLYDMSSILNKKEKLKLIEEAGLVLRIKQAGTRTWQEETLEKISGLKNIGCSIYDPSYGLFFSNEEKNEFVKVYDRYSQLCIRNRKLDFDDMVTCCLNLFKNNKSIQNQWQNIYKYILVDEFQDINPAQYEMLKMLEGSDHNIFAVGDDDQSIYGFRGAAPGIMQAFIDDHEMCETVFLRLNYRCCYQVVEAADTCIRHNKNRLERDRQQTLKNRKPGKVIVNLSDNEELEAEYIASEIHKLNDKPLGDIAVIYRSEHCISLLEEKLKSKGFKYEKKNAGVNFYELDSVSTIISYIRIAANKCSFDDYLHVLNHPDRRVSRDSIEYSDKGYEIVINKSINYYKHELNLSDNDERIINLNKLMLDLKMVSELPPTAAFFYILKGIGLEKDLAANYRKISAYPFSFDELLIEVQNRISSFKTLEGLIDYIDRIKLSEDSNSRRVETTANKKSEKKQNIKITFITAHASKGLEYPVVFVAGLQEGLFPHRKNLNEPGIEEERRLFYVAVTRAKECLYLCGRGSEHGKRPSRFINEVMKAQSFIASNSSLSRNSSKASATASYSSSSSINPSSGSTLGSFSSSE